VNSEKQKTIKIKESTYNRLTAIGQKNETYDDIVASLLNETAFVEAIKKLTEDLKTAQNNSMRLGFGKAETDSPLNEAITNILHILTNFVAEVEKR
jgi:hypothetical protein